MRRQIHNRKALKTRHKELRNNLTSTEASLWKLLQHSKLNGGKFRRQHSVGSYILDFYCPAEKLAVELDGKYHFTDEGIAYDKQRTKDLNNYGIRVIRFENKAVFEKAEFVLECIANCFTTPSRPCRDTTP